MTRKRHLREGDRLDDDETVVVRGGRLDRDVLRADAQQYQAIYGHYGLSVIAARDVSIDELAQQVPLVRFEVLTLIRAGVLRAAGFRLDATGRNPRHFTLVLNDLDSIETLVACEQRSWPNPYHED